MGKGFDFGFWILDFGFWIGDFTVGAGFPRPGVINIARILDFGLGILL
jgi:hypothetical protein